MNGKDCIPFHRRSRQILILKDFKTRYNKRRRKKPKSLPKITGCCFWLMGKKNVTITRKKIGLSWRFQRPITTINGSVEGGFPFINGKTGKGTDQVDKRTKPEGGPHLEITPYRITVTKGQDQMVGHTWKLHHIGSPLQKGQNQKVGPHVENASHWGNSFLFAIVIEKRPTGPMARLGSSGVDHLLSVARVHMATSCG